MIVFLWDLFHCFRLLAGALAFRKSCNVCVTWREGEKCDILGIQFTSFDFSLTSEFNTYFSMWLRRKLLNAFRCSTGGQKSWTMKALMPQWWKLCVLLSASLLGLFEWVVTHNLTSARCTVPYTYWLCRISINSVKKCMAVGECLEECLLSTHSCTVVVSDSQNNHSIHAIHLLKSIAGCQCILCEAKFECQCQHAWSHITYTKSGGFPSVLFTWRLASIRILHAFNAHAHRLADKGNWIKLIWLERLAQSSASGQSFANAVRPKG